MKVDINIKLDTRKLDKLIDELRPRAEKILDASAMTVQAEATRRTTRVDTGAMKGGWRWKRSGDLVRTVWNTQDYAIYHEFGTVKMSAAPMLTPTIEWERPRLAEAWEKLLK
jgi:HK97 gp10 family phage protein